MSVLAERKCALFLTTLRKRDRRRLLADLPAPSAQRIRRLLAELEAMPFPVASVAAEVLADEVRGLTATTSLDLNQLMALSKSMSPMWFARVLAVWPNVDRAFCLSVIDESFSSSVKRELKALPVLPPKLMAALQAEAALHARPDAQA